MADGTRGTYKTYKDSTTTFLTWLAETAQSRGHQIHAGAGSAPKAETATPTTRLKGKARKIARDAALKSNAPLPQPNQIYQLSLKEFTACAHTLANARDPLVVMSPDILAVANQALVLRKRCTNWFARQSLAGKDAARSNRGHRHFNHWLEDILSILKSCGDAFQPEVEPPLPDYLDLSNRFASLGVEEPSLSPMGSEATKATLASLESSSPSPAPGKQATTALYTIEDQEEDLCLAIFCLYEDLNHLRRQVCWMWTQYRVGKMDLISVSLATSVALELGVGLEMEFLGLHPDLDTGDKIVAALLGILRTPARDPTGLSVHVLEGGVISMSRVLFEWLLIPAMTARRALAQVDLNSLVTQGITNNQELAQKLKQMSEDSAQPNGGFLHRERIYQSHLVSTAAEIAVLEMQGQDLPIEDVFTQSLRTKKRMADQPLSNVFVSQAFLDIKEVMGDRASDAFDELIQFRDEFSAEFQVSEYEPGVAHTLSRIWDWIKVDPLLPLKNDLLQQVPRELLPSVKLLSSPAVAFKLYKEHPLLCGLMLFDFRVAVQEAAIFDANQRISILSCAHLYNAVRKTNLLPRPWEDLEDVLSVHSESEFFLGSRPSTLDKFARQWIMVNGVSATLFSPESAQRLQRNPGALGAEMTARQTKERRQLTTPTPLAQAVSDNYRLGHAGSSRTLGPTRPNTCAALAGYAQRLLHGQEPPPNPTHVKSALATLPIGLRVSLVQWAFARYERQALAFNYARMHQRCFSFLRSLLPLSPEVERLARETPQFDSNAVLVSSLFMMEGRQAMALGITSDTAGFSGTTLKEVARRMNDLIEREGRVERESIRSHQRFVEVEMQKICIPQPICITLSTLSGPLPQYLQGTVELKWSHLYHALKGA